MGRLLAAAALTTTVTLATASPGAASQCAALIHSVYAAAGTRFDTYAHDARAKAAEAARLHREGRHEDATKIACEGRELLALRPTPTCPQPTR
jgi:hypothetical protein